MSQSFPSQGWQSREDRVPFIKDVQVSKLSNFHSFLSCLQSFIIDMIRCFLKLMGILSFHVFFSLESNSNVY